MRVLLFLLFLGLISTAAPAEAKRLNDAEFATLLNKVADGWNRNDAAYAAAAFHEDAVYTEPPAKQLYKGRERLFRFFGGPNGRKGFMKMQWHHVSFNEATQTGAGEFTFGWPGGQVHGMVSIKVRDGLIGNWREYLYASDLPWEQFQGENRF